MTDTPTVERVTYTPQAAALLDTLKARHGDLLFHQSGGCCDGSSPMCYPAGEFRIGSRDVYLGDVYGCPFYMSGAQFALWRHTHLTVDVVAGRGGGFSCESPEGVRFLIRSRLFTPEETAALAEAGEPPTGAQ
ncbi:MAG: DUF779 domain-containing protein [Armatimonadetes bacterium]|nr:DUF779 domain-containing protein [Armatimonadota bacterium]